MSYALAKTQVEAIQAACRQHQVQRMHLFGSALRAVFDLERQLLQITGKPVDLVMADAVRNPYVYVRADSEATKLLIYDAQPCRGIPRLTLLMSLTQARPSKTRLRASALMITATAA